MSNYENIKPYAEFNHKVAPYGGPEKYVNKVAQTNFDAGVLKEKGTELGKGTLLLTVGIAIWESGKFAIKKYLSYRQRKMNEALTEAENAKKECIIKMQEGFQQDAPMEENNVDTL